MRLIPSLRSKKPLAEPDAGSPQKVLFVCTANICRSPVAEVIFNSLAADRGLPYRAESAGTAAVKGKHISSNAAIALGEMGFFAEGHRSNPVSETVLRSSSLVLTMTPQHIYRVQNFPVDLEDKLRLLTHYANPGRAENITDPYGHTLAVYRTSVHQIFLYVESFVEHLSRS